jgi:hypothetical protein
MPVHNREGSDPFDRRNDSEDRSEVRRPGRADDHEPDAERRSEEELVERIKAEFDAVEITPDSAD